MLTFPVCFVPNVPCGVERVDNADTEFESLAPVPNVPCGVESYMMKHFESLYDIVPNVPCGVERHTGYVGGEVVCLFLMCRVELKGIQAMWVERLYVCS